MKPEVLTVGPLGTNCYLVRQPDREDCVVIDPGYQPQDILLVARRLGRSITAILLTHGHFDHVTAVKELAAAADCAVYISEKDLSLPRYLTGGRLYYTHLYRPGETLELGGMEFQILETPGHTAGSVCILTGDSLFSGDTLFAGSCGRTDLPGGSPRDLRASLRRLAGLPGDYAVYPGHGDATTLEKERRENPYMRSEWN